MGEYIGEHSIHKKKKKKEPKFYGPRMISDKEEEDILNLLKVKVKEQEQENDQPNKVPITGDPSNLLTAGTTTARPKVNDILTNAGVT